MSEREKLGERGNKIKKREKRKREIIERDRERKGERGSGEERRRGNLRG